MISDAHRVKPDTTIDLGRMWAKVTARRGRIALAAGLSAALVGGFVALQPRPSVIEARVLVEPRAQAGEPAGDRLRREDRVVGAQVDLFASTALARRVVATAPEDAARLLGDGDGQGLDRATADERRAAALGERLAVERVDRSRLVTLRLSATDPEAAGRLLDALVREETTTLAETRARIRAEVDRRFAPDLAGARDRLAEAEAAAALPKLPHDVEVTGSIDLAGERTALEVRLQQLEAFAAAGESGAEKAVDAAPTTGLRLLREERGRLRARLAELSVVYLGNHPLMKALETDFAELRRKIRAELPRAIAGEKAALADLDRRLVEAPATVAAAAIAPASPEADVEALRAAVTETESRRAAARTAALGDADVDLRPLGAPIVVAAPSLVTPVLAGGLAGGLALLLSLASALATGAPGRRTRLHDAPAATADLADETAAPVVIADRDAPAETEVSDADAATRAGAYAQAVGGLAVDLWAALAAQFPAGLRVAVVSTTDAARARGAAEALAAVAADISTAGVVDLVGSRVPAGTLPGLSDLLDGTVPFSEALHRDRDNGVWSVPIGSRAVDEADLLDPAFAGVLEALSATWEVVIVDAGRLEATAAVATLIEGCDAVVLAEDDHEDPRALLVFEALLAAEKPTWLIEASLDRPAAEAPAPIAIEEAAATTGEPIAESVEEIEPVEEAVKDEAPAIVWAAAA